MSEIHIAGRRIGKNHAPFIIAEMSGNHNRSLKRALEIVDAAAAAGAHALKIQTYRADTMTLDVDTEEFHITDSKNLWEGKSLYQLYEEAHTPWEWHKPIFDRARNLGLVPFSTPFDETAIDFLEELNVPCYKIASFENTDTALIEKAASTHKPLIISTGMATLEELQDSVEVARSAGVTDLILLKCTSSYPAAPEDCNLLTVPDLINRFNCEVGLSDHTLGIGVATASIALGATVIEKHFTIKKEDGGVDSAFSIDGQEMSMLVAETERAWLSIGSVKYGPTVAESGSLQFRRSLYVCEDLKEGAVISKSNVKALRPGYGLPPKYLDELLGRCVNRCVKRGTPMSWDIIN